MKNRFDDIKGIVDDMQSDFSKFYEKNNNAAGTRVRKQLKDLRDMAQEIRKDVQAIKNKGAKK